MPARAPYAGADIGVGAGRCAPSAGGSIGCGRPRGALPTPVS